VVAEVSRSFDEYWNSEWAFPITSLAKSVPTAEQAAAAQAALVTWVAEFRDFAYPLATTTQEAESSLRAVLAPPVWAPAQVLHDDPGKAGGNGGPGVAEELREQVRSVQRELLIEVAYFIPTPNGVDLLGGLVERGVKVRVLTNSLATNDLVPGHAGYSRYREDLLRQGVYLFEFRPAATAPRAGWSPLAAHSRASLHSKAMVLDGRKVFIGSFNLNPRSAELNTEIGVIVDSAELSAQVARFMDSGVTPDNAWQLHLATSDGRSRELVWVGVDEGKPEIHDHDPGTSWWQRFVAWTIARLPIEREL
jgi:putative cardiolipin synthase